MVSVGGIGKGPRAIDLNRKSTPHPEKDVALRTALNVQKFANKWHHTVNPSKRLKKHAQSGTVQKRAVGETLIQAVGLVDASIVHQRRIRTLFSELEAQEKESQQKDSDEEEDINPVIQAAWQDSRTHELRVMKKMTELNDDGACEDAVLPVRAIQQLEALCSSGVAVLKSYVATGVRVKPTETVALISQMTFIGNTVEDLARWSGEVMATLANERERARALHRENSQVSREATIAQKEMLALEAKLFHSGKQVEKQKALAARLTAESGDIRTLLLAIKDTLIATGLEEDAGDARNKTLSESQVAVRMVGKLRETCMNQQDRIARLEYFHEKTTAELEQAQTTIASMQANARRSRRKRAAAAAAAGPPRRQGGSALEGGGGGGRRRSTIRANNAAVSASTPNTARRGRRRMSVMTDGNSRVAGAGSASSPSAGHTATASTAMRAAPGALSADTHGEGASGGAALMTGGDGSAISHGNRRGEGDVYSDRISHPGKRTSTLAVTTSDIDKQAASGVPKADASDTDAAVSGMKRTPRSARRSASASPAASTESTPRRGIDSTSLSDALAVDARDAGISVGSGLSKNGLALEDRRTVAGMARSAVADQSDSGKRLLEKGERQKIGSGDGGASTAPDDGGTLKHEIAVADDEENSVDTAEGIGTETSAGDSIEGFEEEGIECLRATSDEPASRAPPTTDRVHATARKLATRVSEAASGLERVLTVTLGSIAGVDDASRKRLAAALKKEVTRMQRELRSDVESVQGAADIAGEEHLRLAKELASKTESILVLGIRIEELQGRIVNITRAQDQQRLRSAEPSNSSGEVCHENVRITGASNTSSVLPAEAGGGSSFGEASRVHNVQVSRHASAISATQEVGGTSRDLHPGDSARGQHEEQRALTERNSGNEQVRVQGGDIARQRPGEKILNAVGGIQGELNWAGKERSGSHPKLRRHHSAGTYFSRVQNARADDTRHGFIPSDTESSHHREKHQQVSQPKKGGSYCVRPQRQGSIMAPTWRDSENRPWSTGALTGSRAGTSLLMDATTIGDHDALEGGSLGALGLHVQDGGSASRGPSTEEISPANLVASADGDTCMGVVASTTVFAPAYGQRSSSSGLQQQQQQQQPQQDAPDESGQGGGDNCHIRHDPLRGISSGGRGSGGVQNVPPLGGGGKSPCAKDTSPSSRSRREHGSHPKRHGADTEATGTRHDHKGILERNGPVAAVARLHARGGQGLQRAPTDCDAKGGRTGEAARQRDTGRPRATPRDDSRDGPGNRGPPPRSRERALEATVAFEGAARANVPSLRSMQEAPSLDHMPKSLPDVVVAAAGHDGVAELVPSKVPVAASQKSQSGQGQECTSTSGGLKGSSSEGGDGNIVKAGESAESGAALVEGEGKAGPNEKHESALRAFLRGADETQANLAFQALKKEPFVMDEFCYLADQLQELNEAMNGRAPRYLSHAEVRDRFRELSSRSAPLLRRVRARYHRLHVRWASNLLRALSKRGLRAGDADQSLTCSLCGYDWRRAQPRNFHRRPALQGMKRGNTPRWNRGKPRRYQQPTTDGLDTGGGFQSSDSEGGRTVIVPTVAPFPDGGEATDTATLELDHHERNGQRKNLSVGLSGPSLLLSESNLLMHSQSAPAMDSRVVLSRSMDEAILDGAVGLASSGAEAEAMGANGPRVSLPPLQ